MIFKRWRIFAGLILLVAATAASALSLGRVRGTALLGRGLDLSIQSTLEAQELTPDANCFAADVFYGDTRISSNAVSITPERSSSGELRIRIRTTTAVDEPVVTVFLRVSCAAAVSRRYVLLADALTDADIDSAQSLNPVTGNLARLPALTAAPRVAFGGAAAAVSSLDTAAIAAPKRNTAAYRAALRQAQRELSGANNDRTEPRPSVVRKPTAVLRPRLQVDLLDFSSLEPSLRSSLELGSVPTGDANVRSQAQALWRSLNASPEDAMKDAMRLNTLETQILTAIEQSKRQGQDIASLSTQLQAAQQSRYLNPLTIFLAILALSALSLCLLLWQRTRVASDRQSKPWWGAIAAKASSKDEQHLWQHLSENGDATLASSGAKTSDTQRKNASNRPAVVSNKATSETTHPGLLQDKSAHDHPGNLGKAADALDFKPSPETSDRSNAKIQPLGSSAPAGRSGGMGRVDSAPPPAFDLASASSGASGLQDFSPSGYTSSSFNNSRVVAAEELFDIQEQADFFVSLGQPEQAIEVLKNHITENVETSALAYMDLFDIYHRTSRQADYAQLREEFNRVFNAQVPDFAEYGAQSKGLEDFPQVLGSIQAIWDHPLQARELIEESIFRQPEQDQQPLDMTAYRELMLLYALSKELGRPGARFSLLPDSMQSVALPALTGGASLESPDVDLGDGLIISTSQLDMLSYDQDQNLEQDLIAAAAGASRVADSAEHGLDFDLTESQFMALKLPGAAKKAR